MKRLILAFTALAVLACAPLARAGVAIEHWVSPSGARVFYVASRGLPILDVQVDFAAGSMFDPQGKSGTAALTRALLDLGAGDLDENALADRLADVGAVLSGGADTDRASVALRTLAASDKRGPALEVMRAVLTAPRYDAAIFQREQARTVTSLKDALARRRHRRPRLLESALPDHPYGRQSSPESVAALSRDEVLSFYRSHYTARNASVTLVGDLSRAEAETIAEALVAGLPAGAVAALPAPPSSPKGGRDDVAHPAAQAHIMVGLPTVERGNPDFFPLLVGNYTLGGGGFISRLMKEVRDKRGYAYSVYSYFAPLKQAGPFQIGLQTKRSQARDALAVSLDVLKAFLAEGPTAQELEAAKANLTGSFPLRLDSNKKILDNVANIGFYGLPLDYLDRYQEKIAAVSAADVRRAFARHVRIESLVTVTVAAD